MKIKKSDILLISLLIISTTFFLLQHAWDLSWDFSAYVINARYFFHGGDYYEVYRAPLISVLLGAFMIFGKIGEYLYLIFASVLFFYSNIKLSDSLYEKLQFEKKIKKNSARIIFYIFSLNVFLLYNGLLLGTELLGLSFFEFFLAFWLKNKNSGHFLALAVLSRYNFIIFGILLLINKDYKKIIKNIGIFALTISPWLLYNYLKWGNWTSSIVDSYYLNISSRTNLIEPINFKALLIVANWLIPFIILGIIFTIIKIYKNKKISEIKLEILFLAISLIVVMDYVNTPFKVTRYLFVLTLPLAFFAALGTIEFTKNFDNKYKKLTYCILGILFIISLIFLANYQFNRRNGDDMYYNAAQEIKRLNITDCKVLSPHWVPVNYYTNNVYYLYSIDEALENSEIVLIFPEFTTLDDNYKKENISNYPIYSQKKDFIIIAKNSTIENKSCMKRSGWDKPMVSSPCELISTKLKKINLDALAKRICLKINKN